MGFPLNHCEKALFATGNSDAESAMEWLLMHMDDPDIDLPMESEENTTDLGPLDIEKIESLGQMGFTPAVSRKALKETAGDMERAVDWLFNHPDETGSQDEDVDIQTDVTTRKVPGSDELPANFLLKSIICHKGASIHAGHYVAFVHERIPGEGPESWVLFNDEKVVKAALDQVEEMKRFAYVYFFERQWQR